jgi:hypothetical protein
MRTLAVPALALGLAVGGFGVASAVTGSSSSVTPSTTSSPLAAQTSAGPTPAQVAAGATVPPAVDPQHPWGGQRPDETALTGDTASEVKQAALAKVGGGTVERVETDADGHAAYEAHIVGEDGSLITVFVDKQFNVTGVEKR